MASTYLTRTPGSGQTSRTKGTLSVWLKRAKTDEEDFIFNGFESSSNQIKITFRADGKLQINSVQAGSNHLVYETNRLFRDTSAWYHIVIAIDTTLGTAGDRCKLYVNGVEETSFSTETHFSQNDLHYMTEDNRVIYIGSQQGTANYFDGSMSHYHLIDGTAYDASAFGETDATTGEWKIKTSPSVTYGNHGFFILKDSGSVTDQSGNGNNFTVAGGTLTNTEDNPSNVFCTWNPLIPSDLDYANGNTDVQQTSNTDWEATKGTLGFTEGKYYWEVKISSNSGDPWDSFHGIAGENAITSGATYDATPSVIFKAGGSIDVDGSNTQSGLGQSSDGDIIGIAVDADNSNIDFYRNGTQVGTTQALSSNSGFWLPFSGFAGNRTAQANFGNGYFGTTAVSSAGTNASGNGIFEYDVPTGYTALSTKGLNL
jgi:hypothetical protein